VRRRDWPRTPAAIGTELRRIAPNLREVGIEVEFVRGTRGRRTIAVGTRAQTAVTAVTPVAERNDGGSSDSDDSDLPTQSNGRDDPLPLSTELVPATEAEEAEVERLISKFGAAA
jgi:hypothetical protein